MIERAGEQCTDEERSLHRSFARERHFVFGGIGKVQSRLEWDVQHISRLQCCEQQSLLSGAD